jgi:hypothetical protein
METMRGRGERKFDGVRVSREIKKISSSSIAAA